MSCAYKRANICFDCTNAVPDDNGHGCPWSRKFEPVPGWTAEPTVLNPGGRYDRTETYRITACPLFERDQVRERPASYPVKVRCVETGVVYESMTAAAKSVGGYSANIVHALKSKHRFVYGYHWEVVNEEE